MTVRAWLGRIAEVEELNFLLTNRLPRRLATSLVGRLSRIEQPIVARTSIALWRMFSDIDLSDAAASRFPSMHAMFTRRLRPGARPFVDDPAAMASPCDAIVGANGSIQGDELLQVKGAPYSLTELLGDADAAHPFMGGRYVTLRLTAGMYHRFHAPADLTVEQLTYIAGDCWNVNPIALKRVERLFCRNERAAIRCRLPDGAPFMLVAVAAVLVASIRLTFLPGDGSVRTIGPRRMALDTPVDRGEEMGWFEHGSTIIVLVPPAYELAVQEGDRLRAGMPLARRVQA